LSDTSDKEAVDTLCAYYDAISAEQYKAVPPLCTEVFTVISLYGSATLTSDEAIIQTYKDLWAAWEKQGIMKKIGYDRNQFKVIPVQENVKLIQTQLMNYDQAGNELNSWNCTYVMVKKEGKWLMSLATSDNEATTSIKDSSD
tara:strand:+ start:879 stop:1307 length:429 start_codon:yes stop_codon:yes gene_type:complete